MFRVELVSAAITSMSRKYTGKAWVRIGVTEFITIAATEKVEVVRVIAPLKKRKPALLVAAAVRKVHVSIAAANLTFCCVNAGRGEVYYSQECLNRIAPSV